MIAEIKSLEDELFRYKISLFKKGYSYKELMDQLIAKRKQIYKEHLAPTYYNQLVKVWKNNELTVPF